MQVLAPLLLLNLELEHEVVDVEFVVPHVSKFILIESGFPLAILSSPIATVLDVFSFSVSKDGYSMHSSLLMSRDFVEI